MIGRLKTARAPIAAVAHHANTKRLIYISHLRHPLMQDIDDKDKKSQICILFKGRDKMMFRQFVFGVLVLLWPLAGHAYSEREGLDIYQRGLYQEAIAYWKKPPPPVMLARPIA